MKNVPTVTNKGRFKIEYRGTECLNCGHPLQLSDKFCPNCSQANSTKKLSIKDFLDEFFASFISYDSKLLKTLSALLLRPGKITRDYINGKRVSYTNPFRFLLSLAIIYFLILGITGNFEQADTFDGKVKLPNFDLKKTLDTLQYENESEKRELMRIVDSMGLNSTISEFIKKKTSALNSDPINYFHSLNNRPLLNRVLQKQDFFATMVERDSVRNYDQAKVKYRFTDNQENRFTFNVGRSWSKIKNRPSDFLKTIVSRLPFAIFFFLPIFTLFIWLVYIRKKYNYTDHLIFSFHITSLLFILLIISYLIDSIFNVSSNWIFLTIFSIYLFQAMRKFYGQNIFKTIVKYLFLNTIFFILAMFSTLILIAGNIITY
ncbi:DUF3667 domain-containing protein [Pseudozobellia sp. WGM2]|uniref:DUF3667 domain-containing protein n=1 Tax=Pseudozobellia sp. WGM2 TaxID=2787625 RepID=UPI001AE056AD|nr:DUF3667 domain-containing protein [Pseudozobellia sp. WGM2]